MKVVADQQIPLVREAFAEFGEMRLLPGREISRAALADCDILLVRTVTRVNGDLLRDSPVRFVASATSGTDHVDVDYLRQKQIAFAHAPGCNARSVAEYVVTALLMLAEESGLRLSGMSAGIIGYGHVGSRVARFLSALGMHCVINDPPLAARARQDAMFRPLAAALACDIVSLHVPLVTQGEHPTLDLLDRDGIASLREGTVVINTCRGEVLDETALRERLAGQTLRAVIDVWRNEPEIDTGLLAEAQIGTPHIAGYSQDGRYRATAGIHAECCNFLGQKPEYEFDTLPMKTLPLPEPQHQAQDLLARLARQVYPIKRDADGLRTILGMHDRTDRRRHFDSMRRDYPQRREFCSYRIEGAGLSADLQSMLAQLGFQVCQD